MTRFKLALCALLLALCVLPFTLAGQKDSKVHVIFLDGKAYWLDKPVDKADNLATRDALFGLARAEQAKGDDSFLRFLTEGYYVYESGGVCIQRTPSGGGVIGCCTVGGLGCGHLKRIN